jgi:SAM-dependent methyltransferase
MTRTLYTGIERWFELLPKYLFVEPFIEGKRVLEIDCGTGWGTSLLARSAREVVALGATEADVAKARDAEPSLRRCFQQLIPKDLPFVDGTFDAVFAFRGAEAFGGLEALVEEARRVLRPGGIFCIAAPNPSKKTLPELLASLEAPKNSLGFYELQKKLKGRFAQVRMIAQSPFFGFSFIDYSPEDSDSFAMDSSLLPDGSEDASSFLAFCGKVRLPPVDYSLIQLPLEELYSLAAPKEQTATIVDKASEEELERLKIHAAALMRAKGELEEKVEDLTQRLKKLASQPKITPEEEQQREEQKKQLEEALQAKQELEKAIEEGKAREEKLSAERLRMERNVIEYLGKINEQRNNIKDLEERREELTAKLVRQTNYQRDLQKQITEGRFSERGLQSAIERHENELKEAEKKLQKLEEERKERDRELAEKAESLEKERETLTRTVAELEQNIQKKEEELKQARQIEARARRAEHEANEAKEQSAALSREKRTLEERLQVAEAQSGLAAPQDDSLREREQQAQALLAEKDYLLAEIAAARIDAEWRAEELSQEVALRRSLTSGALLNSLETRAAILSQNAEAATEKVEANNAELQKVKEELASALLSLTNLQEERASLASQKQEIEHALEEAERRAAAARERATAAARDATLARSRQSKLETEIAELQSAQQNPKAEEKPEAKPQTKAEKSLRLTIRRQAELLRRAAVERKRLIKEPPQEILDAALAPHKKELEAALEKAFFEKQALLEAELAQTLAKQRASIEAEAEKAFLEKKQLNPPMSEEEINAAVAKRLTEAKQDQSKLLQELAAVKASLEASRIARAEADKKTKAALERAQRAEEALANQKA